MACCLINCFKRFVVAGDKQVSATSYSKTLPGILGRHKKAPAITFKYTTVFLRIIEESEMVNGTVKFFNRTKHFGFIAGDDGRIILFTPPGLSQAFPSQREIKLALR